VSTAAKGGWLGGGREEEAVHTAAPFVHTCVWLAHVCGMCVPRKRTEIALLTNIGANGRDAIEEMWVFWFREAGVELEGRLKEAGMKAQSVNEWDAAEAEMRRIILERPGWVEVKNRLVTLLYLKGEVSASLELALEVVKAKP